MTTNLTQQLITAIAAKLPAKENIAGKLIDILSISREAAYRRLRGEVHFTFEEVAKIALSLEISLDELMNLKNNDQALFYLYLFDNIEDLELYSNYSQKIEDLLVKGNVKVMMAYNTIPPAFFLPYETLCRFTLYKYFYHLKRINEYKMDDFIISEKIKTKYLKMAYMFRQFDMSYYVLDWNIFVSFIKDARYFYKLNLISLEDMKLIQKELLQVLSDIETTATLGYWTKDKPVILYLSNIQIKLPYVHLESGDLSYSFLHLFSINTIWSNNPKASQMQKTWIESLIRYSTLISQSGELQRANFIKIQKEYIQNMINDKSDIFPENHIIH